MPGPDLVPGAGEDAPRWILGVFGDGLGISPGLYLGLLYVAIGAWAAFALLWPRSRGPAIWLLIGTLLGLFVLAPPLLSLDAFSYISYARLGVDGLNPYEYAPAALPGDDVAGRVEDFRFAVSVYGPLFTWASYPLGAAGAGVALWSLKLARGPGGRRDRLAHRPPRPAARAARPLPPRPSSRSIRWSSCTSSAAPTTTA